MAELDGQPEARESQAGPGRKSERFVVPMKPGNCRWREGTSLPDEYLKG